MSYCVERNQIFEFQSSNMRSNMKKALMGLLSLAMVSWAWAVNVTFTVNMSTYPDGATDSTSTVHIRGSMNGWSDTNPLTNVGGDYWSVTLSLTAGDTVEYKYTHTDNLGNLTWEADPNRSLVVPAADTTVLQYWGPSDAPFTATDSVDVWFRVNMAGVVGYDGGQVNVRGDFNGWSGVDSLVQEANPDFWSGQISMGAGSYGYKFTWTGADGAVHWEDNINNRTLPAANDTTVAWVYFDDTPPTGVVIDTFQVTFTVNTATQDNLTDSTVAGFYVSGSLNGWSQVDTLSANGDYWSKTVGIVGTTDGVDIEYKFRYTDLAGAEHWEDNINNRTATISSDTVLPLAYWDDVAPFTPTSDLDVWFRVNMEGQVPFGYNGEPVDVRGSFNGWSGGTNLTQEGDSYYWSGLVSLPDTIAGGYPIEYKFTYAGSGGTVWEGSIDNRTATIHQDTTLAFKYFDDLAPSGQEIVTAYVYFTVDMAAYEDLGIFSVVRNDSVQVRGGFNGWASQALPDGSNLKMTRIPGQTIYELAAPITNFPNTDDEYKYYIKWSNESLSFLGSPYPNVDWNADWGYEVPPTYGAGNRPFTFEGNPDVIQEIGLEYYMDLPFEGIIPEGQTIDLTFSVDMNNASLFDPSTDTLWLYIKDPIAAHLTGYFPESRPFDDLIMVDDGTNGDATAGDGIYSRTVSYTGKAPYSWVYVYHFAGPVNELEEGGGFGFGRFRCRFIHPESISATGPTWPSSYAFPTDTWTDDPPLTVETPPDLSTVSTDPNELPKQFSLEQNYPNPFNPETEIKFTLPEAGLVQLNIYNVLGQQVVKYQRDFAQPGTYGLRWSGLDQSGAPVPSGVYFYEVRMGDFHAIKKMTLLR
ncbi:MAG: T9SS C-terminal target domain-containing protein [Candidatus Neomarinimicrobiota bacterium]|nr:MAG: T9SS C-terminal target domain-containing protein [Candidatus Neomarinimicrobiota bacterium]